MIPQTRTDLFLAKITGEDVTLPVPQTRFELYLANCAGESYELPAPNSRATLYLAKILGQDVALPVPQTRSELYLASIAGMSVQLPEAPTTREEWYLARWAEDAGYVIITGNPVSFQAVAAKLRQLKIAFSPVQEGSGDPSPENERPIHGWAGVNVWQRGKNLWNGKFVSAGFVESDVYTDSTYRFIGNNAMPIKAGEQYVASVDGELKEIRYAFLDANKTTIGSLVNARYTSVAPENAKYLQWRAQSDLGGDVKGQIELGTTASAFEPYNPASRLIPVVFPDGETYYSGWADPTTGDGLADKAAVDLGSLTWGGGNGLFLSSSATGFKDVRGMDFLSEIYKNSGSVSSGSMADYSAQIMNAASGYTLWIKNPDYTQAGAFGTAMNGVHIVAELAEPIPFHVDPQQINSLAGPNTMWSDANGDLTVEYWKDGNVSDAEALSLLLGGKYTPAQDPEDVPDREALRIITGR